LAPLRPSEIELLIACAHPDGKTLTVPRLSSLLSAPIDWVRLRALAHYHRVQALVYTRLAAHTDLVPSLHLIAMADDFRVSAARNLHLTGELITIAKAFAEARIPVLPHKGPLLAQTAYGDLAMRQFVDLDLLIHPADLPRSITVLAGLGYFPQSDLAWLSPGTLLKWTGEVPYTSPEGTGVDLHWRLTPSHYTVQLDPEILWQNNISVRMAGSDVSSIGSEALLLLLAVHGAKHCWESIGWLADVAWLLRASPNFDWQLAMELASKSNCRLPLLLAASLVENVFQVALPELPVDPAVPRLQQRVISRWDEARAETPRSPELFSFAAALARSRRDSLKHLFGLLFHPTELEWSRRRFPQSLFWLYTPGRAARLFNKYLLGR
jgi:hypothetical protein